MAACLETVRKSDGQRRYYIGGCRVSRATFRSLGDQPSRALSCAQTIDAGTHWHHRHERRL